MINDYIKEGNIMSMEIISKSKGFYLIPMNELKSGQVARIDCNNTVVFCIESDGVKTFLLLNNQDNYDSYNHTCNLPVRLLPKDESITIKFKN